MCPKSYPQFIDILQLINYLSVSDLVFYTNRIRNVWINIIWVCSCQQFGYSLHRRVRAHEQYSYRTKALKNTFGPIRNVGELKKYLNGKIKWMDSNQIHIFRWIFYLIVCFTQSKNYSKMYIYLFMYFDKRWDQWQTTRLHEKKELRLKIGLESSRTYYEKPKMNFNND